MTVFPCASASERPAASRKILVQAYQPRGVGCTSALIGVSLRIRCHHTTCPVLARTMCGTFHLATASMHPVRPNQIVGKQPTEEIVVVGSSGQMDYTRSAFDSAANEGLITDVADERRGQSGRWADVKSADLHTSGLQFAPPLVQCDRLNRSRASGRP